MSEDKENFWISLTELRLWHTCKKHWYLNSIERITTDNYYTVAGRIIHENVHKENLYEKSSCMTGYELYSKKYHIFGQSDIIKFDGNDIYPIEYKRGKSSGELTYNDKIQVSAQILCLSEMFNKPITFGFIYYFGDNKKIRFDIDDKIIADINESLFEINHFISVIYKQYSQHNCESITSKLKPNSGVYCSGCNMYEICQPNTKYNSVLEYLSNFV